ncbi:MAG TPA: hypothetical protein VFF73_15925 [Planctomycetota bacterium]|nr:hypothetical protein [Planctomycetota bacterium]
MKRFSLVFALVIVGLLSGPTYAKPDKAGGLVKRIWKRLLTRFDTNKDGQISKSEVEAVIANEKTKKAEKAEAAPVNSATKPGHAEVAKVLHKFVKDFDQIATDGVVTEAAFKTWFENLAAELKEKKESETKPAPETTPSTPPSSDGK